MPSSSEFSQPRDWTQVSRIAGKFFTIWATREVKKKQGRVTCQSLGMKVLLVWQNSLSLSYTHTPTPTHTVCGVSSLLPVVSDSLLNPSPLGLLVTHTHMKKTLLLPCASQKRRNMDMKGLKQMTVCVRGWGWGGVLEHSRVTSRRLAKNNWEPFLNYWLYKMKTKLH